jgi:hypothetical protein
MRPADVVQDMRTVAAGVQQVAEAFDFLAKKVDLDPGQSYYVSEIPGTHWRGHSEGGSGRG